MEILTILAILFGKMINPILWIIFYMIYSFKLKYILTVIMVSFMTLICNSILVYVFTFKLDSFNIFLDFISYVIFSSIVLKLLQLKYKR